MLLHDSGRFLVLCEGGAGQSRSGSALIYVASWDPISSITMCLFSLTDSYLNQRNIVQHLASRFRPIINIADPFSSVANAATVIGLTDVLCRVEKELYLFFSARAASRDI